MSSPARRCRPAVVLSFVALGWLVAGCDACPAGTAPCDGVCQDVRSDPRSCGGCGVRCLPGWTCEAGACVCPEGTRACGPTCVAPDDPRHCGACSRACLPGAACVDGTCDCGEGAEACGDRCAHLADDPEHCGACGRSCASDQRCEAGACRCAEPDLAACPERCADLRVDPEHCGECGVRCPAGAVCRSGRCECPAGQIPCAGACVDPSRDPSHCGGCDLACPWPRSCADGECRCPEGRTWCDGACVDTDRDATSCGACGNRCPEGAACLGGRCGPVPRWHDTHASGGFMPVSAEWDGRVAVGPDGHVHLAFSAPGDDVRLVRYAPDGTESWRRTFATGAERVGDLAVADDGTVVLAATFRGYWVSPGRATHHAVSSTDVALVALDAAGEVRWQRFVESEGTDHAGAVALAPGRVVVSGSLSGTFDFGGGPRYADSFRDAFLLELDPADGSYVDARVYGAAGTEYPVFVALAPDGDVIVAGFSGAGVNFGGGPTSGVRGGFLARLGPDYAHRWSRAVPAEAIHGVAVDAAGDVHLGGAVERTTDFGDGVSLSVPRFERAAFLLTVDGATGASRRVSGVAGAVDIGRGPVVDARGNVWSGASVSGAIGGVDAVLSAHDAAGASLYRESFGSAAGDLVTGLATAGDTLAFAGRFQSSATFFGTTETASDFDVFLLVFDL